MGLGLFLAALAAPLFTWLANRGRSAALALALTIAAPGRRRCGARRAGPGRGPGADRRPGHVLEALQSRFPDAGETLATAGIMAAVRAVFPPEVLADILRSITGILLEVGQSLVFAVIVAALLLLDSQRLARLVSGGLGSQNPLFREAPAIARAAVTYFGVRIRVNAVTAVLLLALMLVLGVDDALLWASGRSS